MRYLYKYRTLNQRVVQFIEQPILYFANPIYFNDPFEVGADLVVHARKKEVINHFEEYLTVLLEEKDFELQLALRQHTRYLHDPTFEKEHYYMRRRGRLETFNARIRYAETLISSLKDSSDEESIDTLKEFYETIRDQLKQSAICCLCRNGTSNPMWANYADESRGIVIEFNDDGHLLNDKNIERHPVNYSETGSINPIECGYRKTYELFHTTKTMEWMHEQEDRFFIFGDPRPVKIQRKSISAIVLGERTISGEGLSGVSLDSHMALLKELIVSILEKDIHLKQSQKGNSMRFENKSLPIHDVLRHL